MYDLTVALNQILLYFSDPIIAYQQIVNSCDEATICCGPGEIGRLSIGLAERNTDPQPISKCVRIAFMSYHKVRVSQKDTLTLQRMHFVFPLKCCRDLG